MTSSLAQTHDHLLQKALRFASASRADSTIRAYQSDLRDYAIWCQQHNLIPIPASEEQVAAYLADCAAGLKVSTLERRFASISVAHKAAKQPLDLRGGLVKLTMAGIRRKKGAAPNRKRPVDTETLKAMSALPAKTKTDIRDRAILMFGWAFAQRRSTIAALQLEHITIKPYGLLVLVPNSKTDQEGLGRWSAIGRHPNPALCPVAALMDWLELLPKPASGPVFRRIGDIPPPPKDGGFPAGVGNTYSGRHRFRLSHSKVLAHARGAGYWLAQ